MSSNLNVATENLRRDLTDLGSEWRALRKKWLGPSLSVPDTPNGWFEITEMNLTTDRSTRFNGTHCAFPAAWAEVCTSTRCYFSSSFAPWALRVADQLCKGILPFEVPELRYPDRRYGQYQLGTSIMEVAGTNDTAVAGQRLLAWSAMSLEPRRFHRSADFPTEFFLWIPNLIENIILEKSDEIRTLGEVVEWVNDGFEAIVSQMTQEKAIPTQNEGTHPAIEDLPHSQRAAYLGFEYAKQTSGRSLGDREAYDWLKEHAPSEYELLDSFETWSRYVRGARNATGTNKYSKRGCRAHGSSVVRHDQIERIPKRFKTDDY